MDNDELEEYLLNQKITEENRRKKKILKTITHITLSIVSIMVSLLLVISLIAANNIITIISTLFLISSLIIPVVYFYYCQWYDYRKIRAFLRSEHKQKMKHYDYNNRKLKLIDRKWKIVIIISVSCLLIGFLLYPITTMTTT